MRLRIPPSRHPLAALFQRAAESLTTSLGKDSAHYYQCTARHFLNYLDAQHPRALSLQQLRRNPHILGWLTFVALTPTSFVQGDCGPSCDPSASHP